MARIIKNKKTMVAVIKIREKQDLGRKVLILGIAAGIALLSIYFMILTILNSLDHAVRQFLDMWYWIVLLVIGFGTQAGLYVYIKEASRMKNTGIAGQSVAASGGTSTTSMVACCAHHITDFLPFLGLSAAALFFTKYQTLFIVTGVLSNIIGINIMLKIIQEHELCERKQGLIAAVLRIDMKQALYFTAVFAAIIFIVTLIRS